MKSSDGKLQNLQSRHLNNGVQIFNRAALQLNRSLIAKIDAIGFSIKIPSIFFFLILFYCSCFVLSRNLTSISVQWIDYSDMTSQNFNNQIFQFSQHSQYLMQKMQIILQNVYEVKSLSGFILFMRLVCVRAMNCIFSVILNANDSVWLLCDASNKIQAHSIKLRFEFEVFFFCARVGKGLKRGDYP